VENQLVSNGLLDSSGNPFTNTYDPAGKRVLQYSVNASYGPWGTLYFYSITGQRLATYHLYYVTGTPTTLTTSMYFGGRLLAPVDRLGSVRGNANGSIAYFPWGEEEKQSTGYTTPDGTDKYATYFRDGTTNGAGEDYANARYYNNNFGRFWSPDPASSGATQAGNGAGAGASGTTPGFGGGLIQVPSDLPGVGAADQRNPVSWNRYVYAQDDPVNGRDPTGLDTILVSETDGLWQVDGFAGSSWTSAPTGGLTNAGTLNNGFGGEGTAGGIAYGLNLASSYGWLSSGDLVQGVPYVWSTISYSPYSGPAQDAIVVDVGFFSQFFLGGYFQGAYIPGSGTWCGGINVGVGTPGLEEKGRKRKEKGVSLNRPTADGRVTNGE
jgi:hypothetical protein